jgi:hypothetical protein
MRRRKGVNWLLGTVKGGDQENRILKEEGAYKHEWG